MGFVSTLTSKNQTTIPKAIVEALQIKPSATLYYEIESDGSIRLTAKSKTFKELADTFPKKRPVKPVTVAGMKEIAAQAAAERFSKKAR